MDYITAKKYIESLKGRGIVLGLNTMRKLLAKLGNPEKKLHIIHIAGTNGKGSVGAYLSSIITESGMKCARFVSPCVGEYENTFLSDGNSISPELICSAIETVKTAIDELEADGVYPTQFLAETAVAYIIFSSIMPDYAIIECGMGGKEDATNAINEAVLSIITKISLDHTAFLGDTISQIAEQKAGIIKRNTPVISAIQSPDADAVIKSVCKHQNAPLYTVNESDIISADFNKTVFKTGGNKYETAMLGTYQPQNAAIAIKAAQILGIADENIFSGIKKARWQYRFERIGNFILDGAHNPDGASALAKSLKVYTKRYDTAFICACFKDKEYNSIAQITADYANEIYCITAPTPRGLDKTELCKAFKGYNSSSYTAPSLKAAIDSLKHYKNVVIFGTLSILSDAKKVIERSENDAKMQ